MRFFERVLGAFNPFDGLRQHLAVAVDFDQRLRNFAVIRSTEQHHHL